MFNGYFLMLFVLVMASLVRTTSSSIRNKRRFVVFSCIVLIAFIGLRDVTRIGVDSRVNYPRQFEAVSSYTYRYILDNNENNYGLQMLMVFCKNVLRLDYQGFIFVEMAFAYIVFSRMIYKYSPSPVQSIICHCGLFFFFLNMDALKQCMAMAFLCLAFDGIIERKIIKFGIFTAIAAFFHLPALIFAPAYLIANQRNTSLYFFELVGMFAVVYFFRGFFLKAMVEVYGATIDEDATVFFKNKVLIMLFIIAFAFLVRPPERNDRPYVQLLQLMGVAAVLQTFSAFSNNFERLADYYFQFSVLFIPMVFEQREGKYLPARIPNAEVVKQVCCLVSCAFFIWRFSSVAGNAYYYTPYKFFWS